MEFLVHEEIEKQLKRYPTHFVQYLNRVEVATYALNRLPPLYASSQKGKRQQQLIGHQKFKEQIKAAVRQGIAAVERDPLRVSTPLLSEADAALQELQNLLAEKNLLDYQQLSWNNLVTAIQRALSKIAWSQISQQPKQSPVRNPNEELWISSGQIE
jgi:hypothetical protein